MLFCQVNFGGLPRVFSWVPVGATNMSHSSLMFSENFVRISTGQNPDSVLNPHRLAGVLPVPLAGRSVARLDRRTLSSWHASPDSNAAMSACSVGLVLPSCFKAVYEGPLLELNDAVVGCLLHWLNRVLTFSLRIIPVVGNHCNLYIILANVP